MSSCDIWFLHFQKSHTSREALLELSKDAVTLLCVAPLVSAYEGCAVVLSSIRDHSSICAMIFMENLVIDLSSHPTAMGGKLRSPTTKSKRNLVKTGVKSLKILEVQIVRRRPHSILHQKSDETRYVGSWYGYGRQHGPTKPAENMPDHFQNAFGCRTLKVFSLWQLNIAGHNTNRLNFLEISWYKKLKTSNTNLIRNLLGLLRLEK